MQRRQLLAALVAASATASRGAIGASASQGRASPLPVEGRMPALVGAAGWLNTSPLTTGDLQGKVVLVQFWTYSCINWLRTLPYVRAWAEKYRERGLVVVGVHTPEFSFEKSVDNIGRAIRDMNVSYPVAVDSNYAIWRAFKNEYWPALYLVDARGRVRHHHFGEGNYAESEAAIQQLLAEAGSPDPRAGNVHLEPEGIEAQADWANLRSSETYVGYGRGERLAAPGGVVHDRPHLFSAPPRLLPDQWALAGDWTLQAELAKLNGPSGRLAIRFHARDLHLVMGPTANGPAVRFKVLLDGRPPGAGRGLDVDTAGVGVVSEPRLHQLVRQRGQIADREVTIEFLDAGLEAYSFTFG